MPDPAGLIEGFERRRTPGHQVEIDALVGGSGPPLLLLHGYPQTRLVWKCIAPRLASHFTLVMPDLRGYGRSAKPEGDPEHTRYAKRTMALDQVATMRALGFERFSVAGHDRGARVAYRLALDHPESVDRLAVLDIIPTAEVWARLPPNRRSRDITGISSRSPRRYRSGSSVAIRRPSCGGPFRAGQGRDSYSTRTRLPITSPVSRSRRASTPPARTTGPDGRWIGRATRPAVGGRSRRRCS